METINSRRVSTSSNFSDTKDPKNQKTLEQRPSNQMNNPSLCKIKKRLAKKSGRSDPDNGDSSKNLLKMLNDNNLTVKVRKKGGKKSKGKILKTGLRRKNRKRGIKAKIFNGRKTVTSIFKEQRSHPMICSDKHKRSQPSSSNPKCRGVMYKKNKTLYSFKKNRKKSERASKDQLIGRLHPNRKFSFLDHQRIRNISTSKFVKFN